MNKTRLDKEAEGTTSAIITTTTTKTTWNLLKLWGVLFAGIFLFVSNLLSKGVLVGGAGVLNKKIKKQKALSFVFLVAKQLKVFYDEE